MERDRERRKRVIKRESSYKTRLHDFVAYCVWFKSNPKIIIRTISLWRAQNKYATWIGSSVTLCITVMFSIFVWHTAFSRKHHKKQYADELQGVHKLPIHSNCRIQSHKRFHIIVDLFVLSVCCSVCDFISVVWMRQHLCCITLSPPSLSLYTLYLLNISPVSTVYQCRLRCCRIHRTNYENWCFGAMRQGNKTFTINWLFYNND